MSRKKIWSLPLALVTALLLVGLLGAAVLATQKGFQIPNQTLTVDADGDTVDITLSDVDGADDGNDDGVADNEAAFVDTDVPSALAYTAMTSNPSVADVEIDGDSTAIATEWWDSLDGATGEDCSKKAMRLGFTVGGDNTAATSATANDEAGLCQDYASLTGISLLGESSSGAGDAMRAQIAVVLAFHWDMLSQAEMYVAAEAAGESSTTPYGHNFGALSDAAKRDVQDWFGADDILAMGITTLTLANDGRAFTAGTTDLDPATADNAGTATITVKASDATGRLIPPADGSGTVGQTFTVTAELSDAGVLDAFASADGTTAGTSILAAPTDSGNLVEYVPRTDIDAEYYEVRISPGREEIAAVLVGGDSGNDGTGDYTHSPHQNPINFSLINGDEVPFQVFKQDNSTAEIQVKPGVDLTAVGSPYWFTLVVNEFDRAPENSVEVDVQVTVVLDNVQPSFVSPPQEASIAERAQDEIIATFTASDDNNQVIIFSIPTEVENALGIEINSATGVLKTKDVVETPIDLPDFIEDNPDTADTDESEDDDGNSRNVHEIEITASDGVLMAKHTLTLTITDVDDPSTGADQKLTVSEDNAGGLANSFGSIEFGTSGDYGVGQQIDNMADISEGDDILFDVDGATGRVFLKEAGTIDFESGIVTYTLTVQRGNSSEFAVISVNDVNEAPKFSADDMELANNADAVIKVYTEETATVGTLLSIGVDASGNNPTAIPARFMATDQDSAATGNNIAYDLWYDGDGDGEMDDPYVGDMAIVNVDSNGAIRVNMPLETDGLEGISMVNLTLRAYDPTADTLYDTLPVRVIVLDRNVAPVFDEVSVGQTSVTISEDAEEHVIFTYLATDADGDTVTYKLIDNEDSGLFTIGLTDGELRLDGTLDYETRQMHTLRVLAFDTDDDEGPWIPLTITVGDVNDEPPELDGPDSRSVPETTKPGTVIGSYTVTDVDTEGTIVLSLGGVDAENYSITDTGDLMTAVWLDADNKSSDSIIVKVTDGVHAVELPVTITITDAPDSISNINVTKANPVPGPQMGSAGAALDDSPANYVTTEHANWGTVLRIEVTRVSPDLIGCGADCVFVEVEADSADKSRKLTARRTLTQEKGNVFVAAVMLVQTYAKGQDADMGAGTMAYLEADEEDEINIRFDNTRDSLDVENDAPEIENFTPEHEAAISEYDVDYTFTVTDNISGIPSPEDLPDTDGDDEYTSVVAVISDAQCNDAVSETYDVPLYGGGINCDGPYEFRPIVDDKDFNEVDGGFDVETTIAFEEEDGHHYVTFIVCDAAGNCVAYDPDVNDEDVALSMVTADKTEPKLEEARTGVKWNSTDNEYDDDRNFIQVVFTDLTPLNPETVEVDDFVVSGHSVMAVHMFDPDDEDTLWGDDDADTEPTRFGQAALYQQIDRSVFIELEDELAPDETPDVTLVPNGVEDMAGNEQDDGDEEAKDWIAPSFTVVSLVSPRVTGESAVLAGDGDEVVITLTVDERLRTPRPDITISYVNAPDGCVDTEGRRDDESTSANEARARGEIITGDEGTLYCANSAVSSGSDSDLKYTIDKVSNTEWVITINEPKLTGYYNFYVEGYDRSQQRTNKGSEGVAKGSISTDFFKKNGEVNTDDAHFFEGDVNLSNPEVRISGMLAGDREPTVELTTPLFIGLDFTQPHSIDCEDPADKRNDCMAESAEYAEDNYSSVTVTSFMLNGVDVTDSVKTTDDETFLVALDGIAVGQHEIEIQAMDAAGNELDDTLEIEFEVESRGAFEKRLNPGWNLVSLPGEPADSSIASVFGSGVEVRTVYTYDPVIPGGWMVAVRETLDSDWQGDLMEIDGQHAYWVLSDAIQDWEVDIPRLAGGAAGTGTPIQPPSIPLYAGWNLIPVVDVTGEYDGKISVETYLNSLDDGLDLARVLSFNTISNDWEALDDSGMVEFGRGYWVFVREAGTLVPGR